MPTQLTDLEVEEVSLVPKGAIGRRFLVLKRDRPEEVMAFDEEKAFELVEKLDAAGKGDLLEALADPTLLQTIIAKAKKGKKLSAGEKAKLKAAYGMLGAKLASRLGIKDDGEIAMDDGGDQTDADGAKGAKDDVEMDDDEGDKSDKDDSGDDDGDKAGELDGAANDVSRNRTQPSITGAKATMTDVNAQRARKSLTIEGIGTVKKNAKGEWDLKKFPEAARPVIQKVLEAAEEREDTLAGEVRKLQREQLDTVRKIDEMNERAELKLMQGRVREFKHLPDTNPDDFAPVLLKVKKADAKAFERIIRVLKAADEALADAGMVRIDAASGDSGEETFAGDATAQLMKIANDRVRKSDNKISFTVAIAEAAKDNPDLYERYRKEQSH